MKKLLCVLLSAFVLFASSCGTVIPERAAFTKGTIDNNVYENKLAGIRFSPGPAWTFSSEESLLKMNGIDESLAGDDDAVTEKLNELTTIYDMTAEDERQGISVAVTFENMSLYVGGSDATVDEYVLKLKGELEKTFENYDVKVTLGDSVKIVDDEYSQVDVLMTVADSAVEQFYYVRKVGDFIISISITAAEGSGAENTVLSMFEPAE